MLWTGSASGSVPADGVTQWWAPASGSIQYDTGLGFTLPASYDFKDWVLATDANNTSISRGGLGVVPSGKYRSDAEPKTAIDSKIFNADFAGIVNDYVKQVNNYLNQITIGLQDPKNVAGLLTQNDYNPSTQFAPNEPAGWGSVIKIVQGFFQQVGGIASSSFNSSMNKLVAGVLGQATANFLFPQAVTDAAGDSFKYVPKSTIGNSDVNNASNSTISAINNLVNLVLPNIATSIQYEAFQDIRSLGFNADNAIVIPPTLVGALNLNYSMKNLANLFGLSGTAGTYFADQTYLNIAAAIKNYIVKQAQTGYDMAVQEMAQGATGPNYANSAFSGLNDSDNGATTKGSSPYFANTQSKGNVPALAVASGYRLAWMTMTPIINQAITDAFDGVSRTKDTLISAPIISKAFGSTNVGFTDNNNPNVYTELTVNTPSVALDSTSAGIYAPSNIGAVDTLYSLYDAERASVTQAINDFKKNPYVKGTAPTWTDAAGTVQTLPDYDMIWTYLSKLNAQTIAKGIDDADAASHNQKDGQVVALAEVQTSLPGYANGTSPWIGKVDNKVNDNKV